MAQGGANPPNLIRGDAHPQPRRAQENGPVRPFLGYGFCCHIGQVRIVNRRGAIGPHVDALVSHLPDDGFDELFGVEPSMVAPYCYFHITSSLILALTAASITFVQLLKYS